MAYKNKPIEVIKYPTCMYELVDAVHDMFRLRDNPLEYLHKEWKPDDVLKRENDQNTPFHARFYGAFERINGEYKNLLKEVIKPYIGEPIVYQTVPTFRIQFPDNVAVGEKHKDSDYSHSKEEINFWLPLTQVQAPNAVWIENKPYPVNYGEILVFDGANLEHENKVNKTTVTRVSFDFRVIPKRKFVPSKSKTINTGLVMDIGGYWSEM